MAVTMGFIGKFTLGAPGSSFHKIGKNLGAAGNSGHDFAPAPAVADGKFNGWLQLFLDKGGQCD